MPSASWTFPLEEPLVETSLFRSNAVLHIFYLSQGRSVFLMLYALNLYFLCSARQIFISDVLPADPYMSSLLWYSSVPSRELTLRWGAHSISPSRELIPFLKVIITSSPLRDLIPFLPCTEFTLAFEELIFFLRHSFHPNLRGADFFLKVLLPSRFVSLF